MSAGATDPALVVSRDPSLLAPKFAHAVDLAIADCKARGFDAYVFEAFRSPALQATYYARGRTVIPPSTPVTNAPTSLYSWHGYGLAVDVISTAKDWNEPVSWFAAVAESFLKFGCKWGGHWTHPDYPHFQWGACKPSPSDLARQLIHGEGVAGVWRAVGAS